MKKWRIAFTQLIAPLALATGSLLFLSGTLQAQLSTVLPTSPGANPPGAKWMVYPDSAFLAKPFQYSRPNIENIPFSGYRLNLATGFNATTDMNPNSFRRGNFIPHEALVDFQHFSLGASYNYGLNNMWKSGGAGGLQNSRNPGLSLRAGFSF